MKKTYTIEINPDKEKIESFEIDDKNLIDLKVQPLGGGELQGKGYRVGLTFTLDAMIAFGTELIRKALLAKEYGLDPTGGFEHIYPIQKGLATYYLGVYLMPDSAELMIAIDDLGTVENVINKLEKKDI